MPLFIGDYLADTMHLSAEQHGVYMLLIMACWRRAGVLPTDEAQLAAIARVTVKRWRELLPIVAPFFLIADDGWRHKRVNEELEGAQRRINRASSGGAGKATKQDLSSDQAGDKHVLEACSSAAPLPLPSPLPQERKIPPKAPRKRGTDDTPEFLTFWEAFPNKVGKAAALQSFTRALLKTDLAALLAAIERYRSSKPPDRQWCNPATFLNQERWLDQPANIEASNGRHGLSAANGTKRDWWDVSKPAPPDEPPPNYARPKARV